MLTNVMRLQLQFRPRCRSSAAVVAVHSSSSIAQYSTLSHERFSSNVPNLVKVPSLPILGSRFTQFLGNPKLDPETVFDFWPEMRRRHGDFYSYGIFGLGDGLHGTVYVIQDPNEMARLFRKEGKFPSGTTEFLWPLRLYFDSRNSFVSALLKPGGPEWKRLRNFVQTDLLSPSSAQRYLPAILQAAEWASRGASLHSDRVNEYLHKASFDMFVNILLGAQTRICDPSCPSNPEDERFCSVVTRSMKLNSMLLNQAYDALMVNYFGIKTRTYNEFEALWDEALNLANTKVEELKRKRDNNQLSSVQSACYVNQAYERQQKEGLLSSEEADHISSVLLASGVDTTGGYLSWILLHVAAHPHVQEKIYEELTKTTKNGKLTEESVTPTSAPYLHACLREAHRLGNSNLPGPIKKYPEPIEVHNVALPAGSVVVLDTYSQQVDPDFVEDPFTFLPDRFLKSAVQARKGTPSEVIDHSFCSGPFSQGARKCPGSRVAQMEATVFIAQLVLDWEMKIPSINHWSEVPYSRDIVALARLPQIEFISRK